MEVSLDLGIRHNIEMINTVREIYNDMKFTRNDLELKLKEFKVKYYSLIPSILVDHKYIIQVDQIRKTRKSVPLYKFDNRPVHFEIYKVVEKAVKNWKYYKQKINIPDRPVCPDRPDRPVCPDRPDRPVCPDRPDHPESDFKLNISDKINLVKILAESNNIDLIIKLKLITE